MQRAIKSCQPENKVKSRRFFSKKRNRPSRLIKPPAICRGLVRLMLYRFLPFFSPSRRMVPINLSLRVSRPSLFRIVPGGRPFFFSNVPTVQSLRVCLAMENLLSKTLKWTESEMNGYCRFADLTVVLILNDKLKFQPCNFGKVADIELIGDFDVKNRKFSVQEDLRVAIGT